MIFANFDLGVFDQSDIRGRMRNLLRVSILSLVLPASASLAQVRPSDAAVEACIRAGGSLSECSAAPQATSDATLFVEAPAAQSSDRILDLGGAFLRRQSDGRYRVERLRLGSAAEVAGARSGDIVLSIESDTEIAVAFYSEYLPDRIARLVVERSGESVTLEVAPIVEQSELPEKRSSAFSLSDVRENQTIGTTNVVLTMLSVLVPGRWLIQLLSISLSRLP